MTRQNTYVLSTGNKAKEILDRQHELFSQESYKQLEKAGLTQGQKVWDIGCGSGAMTEYLADIVGNTGHVYALDISPAQISVSKLRIEQSDFSNVTFITDDVATAVLPLGEADIVYARFFLMHQTSPLQALQKMHLLLKPGGVLVLQESRMSSTHFSKESLEFQEYVNAIVDLGKSRCLDFDIGSRLVGLCEKVDLEKIEQEPMEFRIKTSEAAPSLLARIDELRDGIIDAGLASHEKIDHWKKNIGKLFSEADPSTYVASIQTYVLAWK